VSKNRSFGRGAGDAYYENPTISGGHHSGTLAFTSPQPQTPSLWKQVKKIASPVAMGFYWYRSQGTERGATRVAKTAGVAFIPLIYLAYVTIDTLKSAK
jgi:hypothetical protein